MDRLIITNKNIKLSMLASTTYNTKYNTIKKVEIENKIKE